MHADDGHGARRRSDAARFLESLWQPVLSGDELEPDTECEVRPLRAPRGRGVWAYRAACSLESLLALIGSADAEGHDVYVGVHPRRRGADRGGEASVAVLSAVIADVDCVKASVDAQRALECAMQAPWGPPTVAVWSGGGWHLYWCYRERIDATPPATAEHRTACLFAQHWLNDALGTACADDMSNPDRVLRVPGTHNRKPERRRADGSAPLVRIGVCEPDRRYNMGEILDHVPSGWRAAAPPGNGAPLPTEVPPRLRAILAAADVRTRIRRTPAGLVALSLAKCPACGATGGSCYLTPVAGRLVSFRERQCPAGAAQSGRRPDGNGAAGIPLLDWVARYIDPRALSADARQVLARLLAAFGSGAPEVPTCRVATFSELQGGLLDDTISKALSQASTERLTVVALTTGSGKTFAALAQALVLAAAGRTVVFAVLDHAKADEAMETAERLLAGMSAVPSGGIRVIRGALYHCEFHRTAPDPTTRARIEAAFAAGGRGALCRRCPNQATCEGAKPPAAARSALTITTHAGLATLGFPDGEPPLVIVDESMEAIVGDPLPLDALREPLAMITSRPWRQAHPEAAGVLERVAGILGEVAAAARAKSLASRHAIHVQPQEIWSALRRDPELDDLLRFWIDADDPDALARPPGPPEPTEDNARRPTGGFPDPTAWQLVAGERYEPFNASRRGGLIEELLRREDKPVFLRVPPTGAIDILRPRIAKIPSGAAVVLLDATAHLVTPDIEALALANGHTYEPQQDLTRIAVRGVPPAAAVWLDTGSYARPKTVAAELDSESGELDARVPARLRRMYLAAQDAGRTLGRPKLRAGLLTWLPAARRLRGDEPGDRDEAADACRQVVDDARRHGIDTVFVGHHGRDGKATNAFIDAGCDTLLHYGDPRPDWGVVAEVEAEILNGARASAGLPAVAPMVIYRGRQQAAAVQDIGRSRYSRPENGARPWVLIYAGTCPPRLMEAAWQRVDVAAAPVGTLGEETALAALRARLDALGAITLPDATRALEAVCEVAPSRRTLQRLLQQLRRERGLTSFVLSTESGRTAILAADRPAAEAYLRRLVG